jgi:hypothetical protein
VNDYEVSSALTARIENEGTFHVPHGNQVERYEGIRQYITEVKHFITRNTPPSREQSSSLTALDEATFWANAAIARNEKEA